MTTGAAQKGRAVEIPSTPSIGGNFFGKKRTSGAAPLVIALGILRLIGVVIAVVGFTNFGGHQRWWSAGSLDKLGSLAPLIMMSAGTGGAILFLAARMQIKDSHSAHASTIKRERQSPTSAKYVSTIKKDLESPPKDSEGKYILDSKRRYEVSPLHSNHEKRYIAIFHQAAQQWLYFPKDKEAEVEHLLNRNISSLEGRTYLSREHGWIIPPLYLPR